MTFTPEQRAERLISWEERRFWRGAPHPPMTGAEWRGSLRYSTTALAFAFRDLSRATGWRRLIRSLNRRLAGTWLDFDR